jgi:hypothetical protein
MDVRVRPTPSFAAGVLLLWLPSGVFPHVQSPLTVKDVADYRLSLPVFERFDRASRLIADAARSDPGLAANPLFTREVSVLEDVAVVAPRLEARLSTEPVLIAALGTAKISARDYTTFALALFGARLAHGFVKTGAMRVVPPGVPTDNVAFIEAHSDAIAALLQVLGVE